MLYLSWPTGTDVFRCLKSYFLFSVLNLLTYLYIILCTQPILANPLDRAALEKEESSSLFVLQMPTDLKYELTLFCTYMLMISLRSLFISSWFVR